MGVFFKKDVHSSQEKWEVFNLNFLIQKDIETAER